MQDLQSRYLSWNLAQSLGWHGVRKVLFASTYLAFTYITFLNYWLFGPLVLGWLAWIPCSIPFRSPSTTRWLPAVGSLCLKRVG